METDNTPEGPKAIHDDFVKPIDLLKWLEEQQPDSQLMWVTVPIRLLLCLLPC
jgi:hypothetical protein